MAKNLHVLRHYYYANLSIQRNNTDIIDKNWSTTT